MDIKDIKKAMDNMPMGDGSAFAEISVGPSKHEQFLDNHYGKVALVVLLCVLGVAGWIIYGGMQSSMEKKASAALVAAMPESPATGEISLKDAALQQVVADFDSSRAAVTATYLQAISLWDAGKENEGIARMKSFIDSAPTEEWKAQASIVLACRLMNGGKAGEAESLFRSVVDSGDPTFSGFAAMCLGDMARAGQDNVTAGNFYRDLKEKFSGSAFTLAEQGYALRKNLFEIQSPVRIAPQPAAAPVPPAAPAETK